MKRLIYILMLFYFVSCQQNSENETVSRLSLDTTRFELDSKELVDTINLINHKTDSFLAKPFDLYGFKIKKNGSLSGGSYFEDYHYKPDFKGVGYRFFMFEPKSVNYIVDDRKMRNSKVGYIGSNKKMITLREDGLLIKTFQPNDEFKNQYLNPNEVLIEVIAKYNDFDLPELAFVGLDSITIVKRLGEPDLMKNNCMVYQHNNKVLILNLSNKKVKWLKYVNMKKEIEFSKNKSLFEE